VLCTRFAPTRAVDKALAPTKGRVLDHLGFDVKDLKAFIKMLEAKKHQTRSAVFAQQRRIGIAFITDPWGAYVEINERPGQR